MHRERLEQIAKKFLVDSGFATGVSFSYDEDLNILWCTPETPHARLLTERNGEGLQALNHLVRRIVEKEFKEESPSTSLSIDVLDFGKKHVESLRSMAHMLAERARYFKSSIEVDPMSPYDRRIVHEYVSKMSDLVTESVGEGQKRHIVIRYKEKGEI